MTPDFIASVFSRAELPRNVRLARWLDAMRVARWVKRNHGRLRSWAFGSPMISAEGTFAYQRNGVTRRITFNGRNAQFHALYEGVYQHGYEFETALLLTKIVQGDGAFYDVGANWGYFSLLIAAVPEYTGPIVAFEPNPRVYADLRSMIEQAGISDRVVTLPVGVGSKNGELHLVEEDEHRTGHGRLTPNAVGKTVPVVTLDTAAQPPPSVIKIDAEGMEHDILVGGAKVLQSHRPFVIFESFLNFDTPSATLGPLDHLRGQGFRIFNPTAEFTVGGRAVHGNYGDNVDSLLRQDSAPGIALFEVTPDTRFLFRHQLNLFACHESRVAELSSRGLAVRRSL